MPFTCHISDHVVSTFPQKQNPEKLNGSVHVIDVKQLFGDLIRASILKLGLKQNKLNDFSFSQRIFLTHQKVALVFFHDLLGEHLSDVRCKFESVVQVEDLLEIFELELFQCASFNEIQMLHARRGDKILKSTQADLDAADDAGIELGEQLHHDRELGVSGI